MQAVRVMLGLVVIANVAIFMVPGTPQTHGVADPAAARRWQSPGRGAVDSARDDSAKKCAAEAKRITELQLKLDQLQLAAEREKRQQQRLAPSAALLAEAKEVAACKKALKATEDKAAHEKRKTGGRQDACVSTVVGVTPGHFDDAGEWQHFGGRKQCQLLTRDEVLPSLRNTTVYVPPAVRSCCDYAR